MTDMRYLIMNFSKQVWKDIPHDQNRLDMLLLVSRTSSFDFSIFFKRKSCSLCYLFCYLFIAHMVYMVCKESESTSTNALSVVLKAMSFSKEFQGSSKSIPLWFLVCFLLELEATYSGYY